MKGIVRNIREQLELLGKAPLCNKRPERAPRILNFCFPLCWRCTSVVTGCIFGNIIQVEIFGGKSYLLYGVFACVPGFVDFYLQQKGRLESTNLRRILTGLAVGIGISFMH